MKKRYWLLSTLLTTALLASCAGGPQPVDNQKFLAGLDGPKIPTVQDAMLESALESEKQGNFKNAAQIYQQILGRHPDSNEVALSLAEAYRRSGDVDKALPLYDGLIKKDPSLIAAKEGKGLALIAKNDFDTPAQLFEDVMKVDPKRWKTLNALGILFTTRNLQKEAQQYFTEALKYHPDSPTVLNNMGLSQALERNFDKSITTLGKAASFATSGSPERKRIDLNMALVYAIAGRLDDARIIAENYLTGAALDNNLGLYAHLAKDDQMAKTYLNMALTDSKMYYAKAWDNLQDLNENSNANPGGKPVKKSKPKMAKEKAPTQTLPSDLFPSDIPPTE